MYLVEQAWLTEISNMHKVIHSNISYFKRGSFRVTMTSHPRCQIIIFHSPIHFVMKAWVSSKISLSGIDVFASLKAVDLATSEDSTIDEWLFSIG